MNRLHVAARRGILQIDAGDGPRPSAKERDMVYAFMVFDEVLENALDSYVGMSVDNVKKLDSFTRLLEGEGADEEDAIRDCVDTTGTRREWAYGTSQKSRSLTNKHKISIFGDKIIPCRPRVCQD